MSVPGLPPLPASVNIIDTATLLVADAVSLFFGPSAGPQWGIFLDGVPVVVSDNVTAFSFKKSSRISKYPQAQGAFASYNKVTVPFEPKIRFSTGGSVADKANFIASIDAISGDLNLYTVITPEVSYPSCNVIDYDYDRAHGNAGLLEIEVMLEQVVIAGSSTFSNTTSPTDAAQTNNGLVQPQATQTVLTINGQSGNVGTPSTGQ
jgi:hypothetical protein